MWSIPISHFTRVGGHFVKASLSGITYITINVFVMQAFMFLTGYFSKKPERARETAFETFMLPYLLFTVVFYYFRLWYNGKAVLDFLTPPFALWFLFSTFFYKFFLKDLIKIPHLLLVAVAAYYIIAFVPGADETLALGRTFSYFPFFVLGYYTTEERLHKLMSLKKWHCIVLGVVLMAISVFLAYKVDVPVGWYLLKTTCEEIGIPWYTDIIMRTLLLALGCGWIILMINIIPNKKCYLSYVGCNTMPIYIFHLFVRYVVKRNSFPCPNDFIYYLCIYGGASLCVIIFSSPPVAKAYDFCLAKLYNAIRVFVGAPKKEA